MSESVRGSCLCGAVTYRVTLPFRTFMYCHCSRCRKTSGSAYMAHLFTSPEQFAWEQGEEQVRRFELPTAQWFCTTFCTTCGSSLPWLTRNGKAVIVPAGALDEDPELQPKRNIYFGSRPAWYLHAGELETFETTPPRK
jgi:hypothetical protein